MSRQSYYPQNELNSRPSIFIADSQQRQSFVPGQGGGSASARLQAKRQELEGLLMLKEKSARLARDIEKLGDNVDALVEGGEAVASVMSSWSGVFRAMQIARQSMLSKQMTQDDVTIEQKQVPDTLVRLPVDTGTSTEKTKNEA
ncbi:uncharacterized protein FA14DRAFT_160874 [Meira miltonrushii]|uniref:DASH complex subunit DAD2 n=1 Tax=Meira miltonrushii TaxID=1280837 RepID=A0A316VK72_9BASI|nr:uncharacterized protein FA14DRAFT_160874 [Meira miltonrushii]PWN35905.1 hypothetical protein FA14DRAFT_160874 [Meira miltonrushii]